MATKLNRQRDLREELVLPMVSQFSVEPLVVTPVVTDDPVSHLIENDLSLVAATGDPTLRPLADYLANSIPVAGDINVRSYGAKGDGVTDDTAAVRAAVLAFKQTVTVMGAPYAASRLVFPPGVYLLTGSLNFQSITPNSFATWEVFMMGAVIHFAATGKTLFDCLGSRYGKFTGGLVVGDSTNIPAICFQIGRLTALGDASGFTFSLNTVQGKWSRSCWYNLQSEIGHYEHIFAYNQDTAGGRAFILDGLTHEGAITDFTVPAQAADTQVSCIQHTFVTAALFVPAGGAPVVDVYGANQIHFYNSYGAGTGTIIRNTAVGVVGSTLYDLHYDVHCEINTNNIEFQRLSSSGAFIVEGLYINDLISQATSSIIKGGTNVTLLVLNDAHAHTGPYAGALYSGAATLEYGGTVRGNPASSLLLGNADFTLSTTAGALGVKGAINRVTLGSALTTPRTWTLPPAANVPPGWGLTIADIVGGISATNTLIIDADAAETINNALTLVLSSPRDSVTLVSDGVSKWTVGSGAGTVAVRTAASHLAASGTAIPAGGTAGTGYSFSSTANFGLFFGSGAPTLSAAKGSLYLRSDGTTTNDRAYINTNGSTTWTALTTAA